MGRKLSQIDFLSRCRKIHGNKYDYSKSIYINDATKVCIICPVHGEFYQTPNHHFHGEGCPKCAIEKNTDSQKMSFEEFVNKANIVHNGKYTYMPFENYVNNKMNIDIICPIHGTFRQMVTNHLGGHGCPQCGNQISKAEKEIQNFIQNDCKFKIEIHNHTIISPYELDIFIPEKKVAIEYDGLIWHSEKFGKDKYYHLNKTELCEKQRIRLIHIFEDEWLEHEDIVKSKLKHILGCNKGLEKIYARKCVISETSYKCAYDFLSQNHIQGGCVGSIYISALLKDTIVGIMVFKKTDDDGNYELARMATDIHYNCIGLPSKMFKYFIKNISFYQLNLLPIEDLLIIYH